MPKTTDKQTATNRAKAQNSTGPRTPAGKSRASQNARKHAFHLGPLPPLPKSSRAPLPPRHRRVRTPQSPPQRITRRNIYGRDERAPLGMKMGEAEREQLEWVVKEARRRNWLDLRTGIPDWGERPE